MLRRIGGVADGVKEGNGGESRKEATSRNGFSAGDGVLYIRRAQWASRGQISRIGHRNLP